MRPKPRKYSAFSATVPADSPIPARSAKIRLRAGNARILGHFGSFRPPMEGRMAEWGSNWTDQRVESLKSMWDEGLSCSQIADELGGVSRNGVIGKVHRMGLAR